MNKSCITAMFYGLFCSVELQTAFCSFNILSTFWINYITFLFGIFFLHIKQYKNLKNECWGYFYLCVVIFWLLESSPLRFFSFIKSSQHDFASKSSKIPASLI